MVWLLKGTILEDEENTTTQSVISGRKIYPIIVILPLIFEQKFNFEKVNALM